MAAARAVRRAYDDAFAALSLNLSEASVLATLANEGPMTQTDLARRIRTSRARIGMYVDSLESKGAVIRDADPEDRRVWRVSVTPAGQALWEQSVKIDRAVRTRLRVGTTAEERRQVDAVLQVILENCS